MGKNKPLRVIVLGGGPSGLCAAWNLVQDGYEVMLLEKEPICGGQSITFQKGEYRYDLGPHNIHSQRKIVIGFLKNILREDFFQHEFSSQIYFRNRRINYPFMGADLLRSINPITAIGCLLNFASTHVASFFLPDFKDNESYETWIVNRFGRKFYNIYFAPYSQKVWKIPPNEISDVVAKSRIAVSSIIEIIHTMIFKTQRYHPENARMIDNFYPRKGIGSISDFFTKGIIQGGGKIINGAKVEKIVLQNNLLKELGYSHKGDFLRLDLADTKVLSTLPVNELILMFDGHIPDDIIDSARGLDFVSEVFLYMNVKKPDIFGVPLFYFSEPEFPFNRIYDVGEFSRDMVPAGKNAICLEISCNYNDEIWNTDDSGLFEKCIVPLERHRLFDRELVEDYHTRRLVHAYPRFRIGYEKRLKTVFGYISTLSNLISFGRQGLFTYANIDDAIWMGFEVAKNINYYKRIGLSIKDLLPNYIAF